MADLRIDFERFQTVIDAQPEQQYYLDREFLSGGADTAISRAPNAPCLRHRAGTWWVDNDSDRNEAVVLLWSINEEQKFTVPRLCSFALPDGDFELRVWDAKRYRLALTVRAARLELVRPGADSVMIDTTTTIGLPDAEERVQRLFEEKPRTRTILAALYYEYLNRTPGSQRVMHRSEAAKCLGLPSVNPVDSALQGVQRAIWGELGHAEEVAPFLVHRRLLHGGHLMVIPHRDCEHKRSGR